MKVIAKRNVSIKVAQSSFLIFFNTNSLRDRCYHTFICIHENNIKQMRIYCSTSFDHFYTIKGYHSNSIVP